MKNFVFVLLLLVLSATGVSAQQRFVAALSGAQEVPANTSAARGTCTIVLNAAETQITVNCTFSGFVTNLSAGHIHGNAGPGTNAGVLFGFTGIPNSTSGSFGPLNFAITPQQVADMRAHLHYVNLHTVALPGGEIRGQVKQAHTVYDVDGDGRSDPTIFRQSTNSFWSQSSLNSSSGIVFIMGTGAGDIFLNNTADFDGDGLGDPLLLKLDASSNATWSIFQTGTNTIRTFQFGIFNVAANDSLAIADYDGDGKQDPGIFRRSTGDWWVIQSTAPGFMLVDHWGTVNDFPSVGDYDGDGRADLTAVRVESGQRVWYIRNSSTGLMRREIFGASATDGLFFFAPLDYDGDGRQDIAVNRTVSGQRQWHILRSSNGSHVQFTWGAIGSTPLFGDYDGDGKTDFAARAASGGTFVWQILRSSDGGNQIHFWGVTGDQLMEDTSELEAALVQTGPSPELEASDDTVDKQ